MLGEGIAILILITFFEIASDVLTVVLLFYSVFTEVRPRGRIAARVALGLSVAAMVVPWQLWGPTFSGRTPDGQATDPQLLQSMREFLFAQVVLLVVATTLTLRQARRAARAVPSTAPRPT